MKNILDKLPLRSNTARALVLSILSGCTYNTYNYYGNPDAGEVADGSSHDGSIAMPVDAGDVSRADAASDRTDASDVSDAGMDASDASGVDAGTARCQSFGFPGARFPVRVGDEVQVRIFTVDSVPADSYGVNNVTSTGSVDTSAVNPFMTAAVTATGTRSVTAFVISGGVRSDCTGLFPITVE